MAPNLFRAGAESDQAQRQSDGSTANAVSATARLRLDATLEYPLPTAVRRRSVADAVGILDDVRRRIERDPEGARAAALRLVTFLTSPARGGPVPMRGGLAPWQERKINRYIQQRLEWPLSVKELAEQASLSVSHFCRAFKESFGASPHLHLTRLRVERAKRLMLTTEDPLSQIALACGMADQAHLSKLFRREVGEAPNAWRRQNRTGARARGRSGRRIDHASDPAARV